MYPALKVPLENRPAGLPRRLAVLHGMRDAAWPMELHEHLAGET